MGGEALRLLYWDENRMLREMRFVPGGGGKSCGREFAKARSGERINAQNVGAKLVAAPKTSTARWKNSPISGHRRRPTPLSGQLKKRAPEGAFSYLH